MRPLVKVNCGAIAPGLVESELFGHQRGAFSGAIQQRIGRFELADGGTLFLDEVGELPLDIQVKLLRVLQEGEFERLGSSQTRKVDVRVIAATNRDVPQLVEQGGFRQDLFYRLSVFPIQAPALRQRKEDIPLLVAHTLAQLNQRLGKQYQSLSPTAMQQFQSYDWPGNIRELQNVLEHAAIVGAPPLLDVVLPQSRLDENNDNVAVPMLSLQDAERAHIRKVLEKTGGVIAGKNGAAAILDVPPSTLRSRMKKLGLLA